MKCHEPRRALDYLASGAWSGDTIDALLRSRVAEAPDRAAVADPPNTVDLTGLPPQRWTWSELDTYVDRMASELIDRGVRAGDVVAVQLPNCAQLVQTFLAVVRIGAIVTPFPVAYREHELGPMCHRSGARVFVTATTCGPRRLAEQAAAVLDGDAVFAFGSDELPPRPGPLAAPETDPNDCVTICWTSGTESEPKAVPRCHGDWLVMSEATATAAHLGADDVLLSPFPMTNMAGISGMFLPWLARGGVFVPHHPFDVGVFLRQLGQEHATYTVAPPALLNTLLQRPEILSGVDISALRLIGSGSAPLSSWMVLGWRERHGIEVINFFGSNEGIALTSAPDDIPDPHQRASYFPRYGVDGVRWSIPLAEWTSVRLVDTVTGEEVTEPGRPGELGIAGPSVFGGYLEAGTAAPLDRSAFDADGYYHTGDVFEIEGERAQFLRYVDRAKDLVIRGGMNISPAELEGLLGEHDSVAEVAVIGAEDPVLGERVCAVVVPAEGQTATLAELTAFLRDRRVASFKLPERLETIDELPRNPVGKVLKRELRARFANLEGAV